MSFSGIYKNNLNELPETRSLLKASNKLPLCKAVEIFTKYRKIINKRYVFIFNEYKNGTFIYFIDRQSFAKTVVDNIDIFSQELGENFSVDGFLEEITAERRNFLDIIHHHEGILGILLGYGRHNSMLFQKKADILGRCWAYENDIQIQNIKQKKSNDVSSAEEELRYLNEQLKSFSEASEYDPLFPVGPLGFAADLGHPETKKLKEKYSSLRKLINITYSKSNPTDVILNMLFSSRIEGASP